MTYFYTDRFNLQRKIRPLFEWDKLLATLSRYNVSITFIISPFTCDNQTIHPFIYMLYFLLSCSGLDYSSNCISEVMVSVLALSAVRSWVQALVRSNQRL